MGATDLLELKTLVVAPGANATIEIKMRDDGAELEGTLENLSTESSMSGGAISTVFICRKPGCIAFLAGQCGTVSATGSVG